MNNPALNEIGVVTLNIKDGPIKGKFISPLSTNRTKYTVLYIPRYEALFDNKKLKQSLKRYIGTDKVGDNKEQWLENAQHLFMSKVDVENYLTKTVKIKPLRSSPDFLTENAEQIIREIYFPEPYKFKYNNKLWKITATPIVTCDVKDILKTDTIVTEYKKMKLRKIRSDYIKELAEESKDVTTQEELTIIKKHLSKSYDLKYDKFQTEINKYQDAVHKINMETITTSERDIKKKALAKEFSTITKMIKDWITKSKQQLPIHCKIELKLSDETPKKPLSIKNLKMKLTNYKRSCRKGSESQSKKQKEIIAACKKLCDSEEYNRWCSICSTVINCAINPDIHIDGPKQSQSGIVAMPNTVPSKTPQPNLVPSSKKLPKPILMTGAGKRTRRRKRKNGTRGGN